MTAMTRQVRGHLEALEAWDGLSVERLPADDALAAVEAGAQAIHALQAIVARFAARVDRVCEQSPGMHGYARRHGQASGPALLAAVTGFSPGEARRLAVLGRELLDADVRAERAEQEAREARVEEARGATDAAAHGPTGPVPVVEASLDWDALRPDSEPTGSAGANSPLRELEPGELLARAIDSGRIGIQQAEVIRATLADFTIDPRAAEREFVDLATRVGLRKLKAHCFWRLGELDPAGLAIREANQRRERFVQITDGPDGMVTLFGKLDVATAAPIKALLDGMTSRALRRQRKLPMSERLSPGQLCADALADVALHASSCGEIPNRPKTTVVVRIDKDALIDDLWTLGYVDGKGVASCDGILQPITAAAARLMAVDAQVLPAVIGGDSLPMDLGRGKRLFTKAQALAIAERDRGCIRCSAPPAFCHIHHVTFWSNDGATDSANGAMLCTGCHHRLHEQRWELEVTAQQATVRERWPDGQPERSERLAEPAMA